MLRLILLYGGVLAAPAALVSQEWNDPRALSLVRQAVERRTQQLADSGLTDYRATAHGYLTFLVQLGEGFREPPQVVKADELALEVYWRAPNLSKQRIIGRRDTTLLPTDIQYHRDHLGIVQNNFPAIIRLGDGDEVRDVPHPLSPQGMAVYDFALADSLRIAMPGRVIAVREVKVRPRDDREPRVIGALYLDRDNGQVVRMALSFTRAAFLDRQLEDLFVVLENGLVGTRFWLPRRQEVEIRRSATWLDYPVRGIIRGRWEIGDYEINQGLPASLFTGPEIVQAPAQLLAQHEWPSERILDSLPPDVRAATVDEVRRVQAETRTLVRDEALRRARGSALAARGLSEFVRFNRVEGLALGAGLSGRLGNRLTLRGRARYGFDDETVKGMVEAGHERASGAAFHLYASSDFRQAGDAVERSGLINSLAAQEFGRDFTNPFGVQAVGLRAGIDRGATRWTLDVARERHEALEVNAVPAHGRFEPTLPAASVHAWRGAIRLERPTRLGWWGLETRGFAELRLTRTEAGESSDACFAGASACASMTSARGGFTLEVERPVKALRLVARSRGAIVAPLDGVLLAQDLVFAGGPLSAPGYAFHELVGDRALSQRLELQLPVPFPSISLGRFGRSAARATLAPHVSALALRAVPADTRIARARPRLPGDPDLLRPRASGLYPSVGISLIFGFDLLRLDVSHGLRDGAWRWSFDVSRMLWSVM